MSEALSAFKKKLAEGGYKDITGARRGVGKIKDLTDDERITARKMADKYFAAEPVAPKSTPLAERAPKKPAKKGKAAAPKQTSAGSESASVPVIKATKTLATLEEERVRLSMYGDSLSQMKLIHDINPGVDVTEVLEMARNGVKACLQSLRSTGSAALPQSKGNGAKIQPAPATMPGSVPGGMPGSAGLPGMPGGLPGMPGA